MKFMFFKEQTNLIQLYFIYWLIMLEKFDWLDYKTQMMPQTENQAQNLFLKFQQIIWCPYLSQQPFCFTFPYRCKYYFKKQPDINITIDLILISYFCSTEIGRILNSCDVAGKNSLLNGTDTLTGQHRGC